MEIDCGAEARNTTYYGGKASSPIGRSKAATNTTSECLHPTPHVLRSRSRPVIRQHTPFSSSSPIVNTPSCSTQAPPARASTSPNSINATAHCPKSGRSSPLDTTGSAPIRAPQCFASLVGLLDEAVRAVPPKNARGSTRDGGAAVSLTEAKDLEASDLLGASAPDPRPVSTAGDHDQTYAVLDLGGGCTRIFFAPALDTPLAILSDELDSAAAPAFRVVEIALESGMDALCSVGPSPRCTGRLGMNTRSLGGGSTHMVFVPALPTQALLQAGFHGDDEGAVPTFVSGLKSLALRLHPLSLRLSRTNARASHDPQHNSPRRQEGRGLRAVQTRVMETGLESDKDVLCLFRLPSVAGCTSRTLGKVSSGEGRARMLSPIPRPRGALVRPAPGMRYGDDHEVHIALESEKDALCPARPCSFAGVYQLPRGEGLTMVLSPISRPCSAAPGMQHEDLHELVEIVLENEKDALCLPALDEAEADAEVQGEVDGEIAVLVNTFEAGTVEREAVGADVGVWRVGYDAAERNITLRKCIARTELG
ncbi:hypothetical protein B0H12DRAFT_1235787 [Mycena haematopus]|nr:hypothetical protein B0H12DRAFT_1235787 [Mycena haematopus]